MIRIRKIFFVGLCFWAFVGGILLARWTSFVAVFLCLAFINSIGLLGIVKNMYRVTFLAFVFTSGVSLWFAHEAMRRHMQAIIAQARCLKGEIVDMVPAQDKPWLIVYTMRLICADEKQFFFQKSIKITLSKRLFLDEGDIILIKKKADMGLKSTSDFSIYLAKEGLVAWLFVTPEAVEVGERKMFYIQKYITKMKKNIRSLYHVLHEPARTLYGSIFLGIDKVYPGDSLKDSFNQWGIVHYLARSGLHIMIFVLIWKSIFFWLFGRRRIWFFFVFPFVFIYALLTPCSISFMRGVGSFLLLMGAMITKRPYHLSHLLVCLATLFLIINPYSLFFLDFQLSFGLTYVLLCLQEAYYGCYVQSQTKKTSLEI